MKIFFNPATFYWSAHTKLGKWAVMYLCVKGIEIASIYDLSVGLWKCCARMWSFLVSFYFLNFHFPTKILMPLTLVIFVITKNQLNLLFYRSYCSYIKHELWDISFDYFPPDWTLASSPFIYMYNLADHVIIGHLYTIFRTRYVWQRAEISWA